MQGSIDVAGLLSMRHIGAAGARPFVEFLAPEALDSPIDIGIISSLHQRVSQTWVWLSTYLRWKAVFWGSESEWRGVCAQQSPRRISSTSKHGTGLRRLAFERCATNVIVNNTARRSQLQCRADLVHSKAFGLTAVGLEAHRGLAESASF